jgi:hypothetical protein
VKNSDDTSTATLRRFSVTNCCAALTCLGILLAVSLGSVGYLLHGLYGLWAALAAVGVCWAGELVACVIQARFNDESFLVLSTLLGMIPRMFVPLIACAVVIYQRGLLAESGFVYWALVAYLVVLAFHTVWSLPRAHEASPN